MPGFSGRSAGGPAQVFANLERGRFEPVYVLFGADSSTAEEIIRLLKEKLIAPGFEAFDLESLHAEDVAVVEVLQHARQPAVVSARRLVVIRGIDRLRKLQVKELCEGLAQLKDGCTVVLTCDYDRGLQEVFAETGLSRHVVDLRQPRAGDLAAMVHRWAREAGITLDRDAVRLLLEIAGEDTAVLRSEAGKLAAAVEPGQQVTGDMVRRFAGRSRDFQLKEFADAVEQHRTAEALAVLERLAVWGEAPQKIIAWLANRLIWLATDLAGGESGRGAAKWDPEYLRGCLQQLYEINRATLTGHPEPFVLLQAFTICAACPGTKRYCGLFDEAVRPEFCIRRGRKHASRRKAVYG
jgi:DNA polymerase-3 subunit delta